MRLRGLALSLFLAGQAVAAPETSPLPRHRPVAEAAPEPTLHPRRRPSVTVKGRICDIPGAVGEKIAPVRSPVVGCGIDDPVRLRSIGGVRLSEPATVDCAIVHALDTWVGRVLKPAFDDQVEVLQIAGTYNCRGRNHQAGAKISEHGRGRAIDVSGLIFRDGHIITVLEDWNRGERGRLMADTYARGCGIFGTTLGPGSDGFHEDHMHFDMPLGRKTPYCR